MMADQDIKRRN